MRSHRINILSNTSILWLDIEVPINNAILSVLFLQPLIRRLEMSTIQEPLVRTQRTRMYALQHQVFAPIDLLAPILRWLAPCQEHHALCSLRCDCVDDLLRELLPALFCVRICFVGADSQAGVEEKDASICPWCEEAAVLGWFFKERVVFLEGDVHVLEAGRCLRGWADGEAEAVGLVEVVVGVLA